MYICTYVLALLYVNHEMFQKKLVKFFLENVKKMKFHLKNLKRNLSSLNLRYLAPVSETKRECKRDREIDRERESEREREYPILLRYCLHLCT
jgi:hypothetical protein